MSYYLDRDINFFFYNNDIINEYRKNYIRYKIVKDTVVVISYSFTSSLSKDDIYNMLTAFAVTLKTKLKNYNYLLFYPGTKNPQLVSVLLEMVGSIFENYNAYYDYQKIDNIQDFKNTTLNYYCSVTNSWFCQPRECCDFKEFSIYAALKPDLLLSDKYPSDGVS